MPWTNASIVLNSRDATAGTYNALKFNANNQNIIQGQIHSISVNEVNFPYDIPNIQVGFNYFYLDCQTSAGPPAVITRLTIIVTPGFYSGTELATAINLKITAAGAGSSPALLPADMPTVSYDDVSNTFTFNPPSAPSAPVYGVWNILSPYTFPTVQPAPSRIGKDILSIMGFYTALNNVVITTGDVSLTGGSAPLTFTQYVDICSPLLCQYQYFRDGSTTNLARRSDVICRLYISNNVAIQEPEGQRSVVINRQFFNARVMRWSAESSVGQIDVNLFDDVGQPLLYTWLPRPYQITFNCYEQDKDSTTY